MRVGEVWYYELSICSILKQHHQNNAFNSEYFFNFCFPFFYLFIKVRQ